MKSFTTAAVTTVLVAFINIALFSSFDPIEAISLATNNVHAAHVMTGSTPQSIIQPTSNKSNNKKKAKNVSMLEQILVSQLDPLTYVITGANPASGDHGDNTAADVDAKEDRGEERTYAYVVARTLHHHIVENNNTNNNKKARTLSVIEQILTAQMDPLS